MRPHQLTMTAFGPYKTAETINFDALLPHNLFVISGRTGSGKTTIFDALCYALYGVASGSDRSDIRALRSHFAESDTPSTVELIFTSKGKRYRILRQLPYQKPSNKSETPGKIEFFQILDDGAEVEAAEKQQAREVREAIEAIIGFNHDQFSQLVMLPQGEFRKFLTSDTENREAILQKIFNTHLYSEQLQILRAKRDAEHQSFELLNRERTALIHEIKTLPARETPFFERLHEETINFEQALSGLKAEKAHYTGELTALSEALIALKKEYDEASETLNQAKTLNQYFAELTEKQNNLTALTAKAPHFNALAQSIKSARKAMPLIPLRNAVLKNENTLKTLSDALQAKAQEHQQASEHFNKAETALTAERSRNDTRETLQKTIHQLESQQKNVETLTTLKTELSALKTNETRDKSALENNQKTLADLQKTLATLTDEQETLNRALLGESSLLEARHTTQSAILYRQKETSARREESNLQAELESAREILNRTQQERDQAFKLLLENHAERLAENLEEGESCPVCGSKTHEKRQPDLFERAPIMSESEFQYLDATLQQATQKESQLVSSLNHVRQSLAEITEQLKTLKVSIPLETLENHLITIESDLKALHEKRTRYDQVQLSLKEKRVQLTEIEAQKQTRETALHETQTALSRLEARLTEMSRAIPENLQDITAFKTALEREQKALITLQRALETAETEHREAEKQLATLKAELKSLTTQLNTAEEDNALALEQFETALGTAGFNDLTAFEKAQTSDETLKSWETELRTYEESRTFLINRLTELTALTDKKSPADLTALTESATALFARYEAAIETKTRTESILKQIQSMQDKIEKNASAIQQAEVDFTRIERLFNLLRGQNPLKLSFERYILIDYLERVIEAANLRFREMSNGQFEFVRSDTQASHGRQSGLDLDVYDAYTGQNRDVKTMSGGEKFKASLCLSLGMSDVIQSFKGGISIDTLFIDEGFGSLDAESLEQAIDVLIDLQRSGRMIGVISHVEELKEALPARIEITKDKSGISHAEVIIA